MTTNRRYFLSAVMVVAAFLMFLTIHRLGDALPLAASQNDNPPDPPMVEYEAEVTKEKSKTRKEKDARFKGRGNPDQRRPINQLPEGVEPLPILSHWWIGLPALPVEQSDIIVLGVITGREAHLSDDRTGIYSEFTVQLNEIFKDITGAFSVGGTVPVNRSGGNVRFASGKVQKYGVARQGMPRSGSQYVFFLKRTAEGDLLIQTGYELSGGRITPLDGEDNKDPRSDLPFAQYRGVDQNIFLEELRRATSARAGGAK